MECQELPAMDRNGMSDPYVKLTLLPERKPKFETKIKRNSLNPVFDETFLFNLSFNELQRKTLQIAVYDFDRLSKDDRIGQLAIPLDTIDFGDVFDKWIYLQQPETESDNVRLTSRLTVKSNLLLLKTVSRVVLANYLRLLNYKLPTH